MPLYDYGNTRLRARISKLFSVQALESFSDLNTIDSLISQLSKTHYKSSIETALTYSRGYGCITDALRRELHGIRDTLQRFYDPEIWEKLKVLFLRSDVQNIKSIIRGIIHEMDPSIILDSLSPLGVIPEQYIKRISQAKNIQDAIDRMAVYQLEFAPQLLALKGTEKYTSSAELERVIEYWYFNKTEAVLRGRDENVDLLRKANRIEIDITNINTMLRFIDAPQAPDSSDDNIEHYLIDGGSFSAEYLKNLTREPSIHKAVERLAGRKYRSYLLEALDCFDDTHRLSEFENKLRVYALRWLSLLPKLNPFGVGVPMGYLALKQSEIRNIRWIAKGIISGFEPEFIKENIERYK